MLPRFPLLLITTSVLALAAPAAAQPGGSQQATPVGVSPVVEREVAEGRTFVGTVHASQATVVGSAVDGRVEEVPVKDGDWVTKDQVLAELRKKTIGLEIAAAEAELQLRRRELEELNEGSRPDEIARAEAELLQARALFDYAEARLKRTRDLPIAARSQEELDQDISSLEAAKQAKLAAQATWRLVDEGPRREKILQAEAKVEVQRAEIARLVDRMSKYTIKAPFDGYIVTQQAEVGQWITAADPVVEMVAVDPIEVWVSIPEDYIAGLAPGLQATVRLGALPNQIFEATISRIIPQADLRSRSFPVRIVLDNPRGEHGHLIKPGMLAQVALAVGSPQLSVLVPKDALVLGGRSPVVYVVNIDPRTQERVALPVPVQLGVADKGYIQVTGQLRAGQNVVVQGNERLRPGAKVKPLPQSPSQ
jgi:RND family efflux transporter MFP subunit